MKDTTLKCPRCQIEMKQIKREEITIDVCPSCGGMWLDHGEIPRLLEINNNQRAPNKQPNSK